ncbi:MAG: hypothetical protein ACODAE_10705 [Gemmatimonadota bacterium]
MRIFDDESGRSWAAAADEESTPRHHGRWFLVFHPADSPEDELAMPEVRWQSRETAERTLETMSVVELRRRLRTVRHRAGERPGVAAIWERPARLRDRLDDPA